MDSIGIDLNELKQATYDGNQQYIDEAKKKVKDYIYSTSTKLGNLQRFANNKELYATLNAADKDRVQLVQYFYPELLAEPKNFTTPPPIEKMTGTVTPKVPNAILNTVNKVAQTGKFKDYGDWLSNAANKGYLPDLKDKSVLELGCG
jgi:hypothetical protein